LNIFAAYGKLKSDKRKGVRFLQIKPWNAMAAMALNRVIGADGRLPWQIPADMAWFKKVTDGGILVLGRKTLESLQALHPQNTYLVLTHDQSYIHTAPNVHPIHDLAGIEGFQTPGKSIWICGGSEVYRQTLSMCQTLYLTIIKATYEGDAFFPSFEDTFQLEKTLHEDHQIIIQRYQNNGRTTP